LSQGEYIAPEKLENIYIQSPFIAQIFVYGSSLENYLVGIFSLDPDHLEKWCKQAGKDSAQVKADLNSEATLKEEIAASLDELVKKNKLNSLEKVKRFHLTTLPFTVEDGILTPSFKLRRHNAKIFFQSQLEAMYALGDPALEKKPEEVK